MAQTGYTPIQLYFSSTTTNVPLAANLANGELAINITDGKLFYKDNASAVQVIGWKVVPATAGGTGQTSYAVGDLLYANTTTTLAKLADVATGNALISGGVSTAPLWGKIGLTTHVSGTLPVANGGTGTATAFTAGSVVFAGASGVYSQDNANLFFDDTNNRLGVGTAAPDTLLHVLGAATTDGSISYVNQLTATTAYNASPLVGTQVSLKYNAGGSYAGMGGWTIGKENATDGNFASYFAIHTRANGGGITERGRFDSAGNFLISTTNASSTAGVGIKALADATGPAVAVVGSASTNATSGYRLYSTGAGAYRFYVDYGGTISATSTTITGISDQRLKENIRDLDDGLNAVLALKPRKFDWKEGKGSNIKDARGFIAQEFETVFPDMIQEWLDPAPEGEEPYKAINANLFPTLVKAVQELNTIVETQATMLQTQAETINSLTARIVALESK